MTHLRPASLGLVLAFATLGALAPLCACGDSGGAAKPECENDRACQDGDPCTGVELCNNGTCVAGTPPACASGTTCWLDGECLAAPPAPARAQCAVPVAPTVAALPTGDTLLFKGSGTIFVGPAATPGGDPAEWMIQAHFTMPAVPAGVSQIEVVARFDPPPAGCDDARFRAHYLVANTAGEVGIAAEDPDITAWAGGFRDIALGAGVDATWSDPTRALGPAGADDLDVLALGEGGVATFILDVPAGDGPGPDLAVFENAHPPTFHEFAFVEVSSDGTHFVRFPSRSRIEGPVGSYDMTDATLIQGVAGTQPAGVGTPFDLASLRYDPAVTGGLVDLAAIRFVRIVDIVGDGRALDAFGGPIYDPTPTTGSAGFDLDGIGVLGHAAP